MAEFQVVLDQNEKHKQSEVLRELGALYNSAGQFEDARQELARYIERRPYDPEGLYHYGQSLDGLGRTAEAKEIYARSVEAARAAPRYLSRAAAKWSRLAQKKAAQLTAFPSRARKQRFFNAIKQSRLVLNSQSPKGVL